MSYPQPVAETLFSRDNYHRSGGVPAREMVGFAAITQVAQSSTSAGATVTLTMYNPPEGYCDEPLREAAVRTSGILDASGDAQLRWMVESIRRALRTAVAAISVLHQDWQYVVVASGTGTGANSRRTSFCGHAIVGDDPVFCVADAARDPRFAGNPYVEDGIVSFYAGAVLQGPEGHPLGTLCVYDGTPRSGLTAFEHATLVELGTRVSARVAMLRERATQLFPS